MPALSSLGWLQFERLCARVLESEAGVDAAAWEGEADRVRGLMSQEPVRIGGRTLPAPVEIRCLWLPREIRARQWRLAGYAGALEQRAGVSGALVTVVNATPAELEDPVFREQLGLTRADVEHVVIGAADLVAAIDRLPALRLELPFVLSVGDRRGRLDADALARSTLDVDAALELAPVFVATEAYGQALATLRRHAFLVLTGPPEMGKTAIARMLGLALLSDGWEAHECTRPEELWDRFDPARPQLFVADDAFGSTEYRVDAGDHWARALGRALRATDEHHWLIWTSRPAPLHAGLRHIHRERGAERFPQPAQVQVDAAGLSPPEKTLMLYRHARAATLTPEQRRIVYEHGEAIVGHPHFTPERIRRFVTDRLPGLDGSNDVARLVDAELAEPTVAMTASYSALRPRHRELLLAMLDAPPGPVAERDLAAALRRHAQGGLPVAPADLVDRLSDHFVRVLP